MTAKDEPATTRGAQSLHRAMQLLTAVGERNLRGARLNELAQATGLHNATAHRMLGALVREQMISYDRLYTKRYFIGARLHALIDLAPYAEVRPRLQAIAEAAAEGTGLVAYIYVPLLNDMMAIERAEPPNPARILISDVGRRWPMGIGAGSFAFLAKLARDRAHDIVQMNRERFAEFGNVTLEQVLSSIEEARECGYGVTRGQVARGLVGLGLTIAGQAGTPIAALTVVGTSAQMTKAKRASLYVQLQQLASLNDPPVAASVPKPSPQAKRRRAE